MFKDPVRKCLENHGIPENQIEKALDRIEDVTNSVLKMFDDFADFWKDGTTVTNRLKSTERDRRKTRSLRNSLKDLCKRCLEYEINAAKLIEDINRREKAFDEAVKRETPNAEGILRLFLGQNINATVKTQYINEVVVCLVEALTHLTWFDEKWIGLKKSKAFVEIANFLNKHVPKAPSYPQFHLTKKSKIQNIPGSDAYDQEKIRSRYNKNKHKKASITHLS